MLQKMMSGRRYRVLWRNAASGVRPPGFESRLCFSVTEAK